MRRAATLKTLCIMRLSDFHNVTARISPGVQSRDDTDKGDLGRLRPAEVGEVERPAINRDEGSTLAFAKPQARKMLDLRSEDTIAGLRDRAIVWVGLQVGLRRAEIAALKVGDLHQNRGYDSLRVSRKGGRRDALAINPQTAARLRAYLEKAGHGDDVNGPLFRPLRHNGKRRDDRRSMDPDAIDRVWSVNMPARSASIAATRHTRCGRCSSPRRSRTALSSRTCRRPPDTATRAQRSSMIDAATIPRRRLRSLPRTNDQRFMPTPQRS